LAALVVVIILLLQKPQPVAAAMTQADRREKLQDFDSKLQDLESSRERGDIAEAQFTAAEINAMFQARTQARPRGEAPSRNETTAAPDQVPEIRAAQVSFLDDQVTGQFVTDLYGKNVYVTVSGRLGVSNGYVTFDPTAFKIGDMPVPVSLVNSRLQSKLQEPENHEKLKLPDYVSDLRVEQGQLVMVVR
jgi:hypothetical protein